MDNRNSRRLPQMIGGLLLLFLLASGHLQAGDAPGKADPTAHWAWQPIRRVAPPEVDNPAWAQSPVDRFIYAGLQQAGLQPSASAAAPTLSRRISYDLLGLPPAVADTQALQADSSPQAVAALIDRLLSKPEYGENWGRHWLDVVRYADTKGDSFGGEEPRMPFAYTYRDYVIGAFNRDLPYNKFIVEQIAADRLDVGDRKETLAAVGMLTVGDRFLGNRHHVIDDQIDVVTRGFMGLTVACARCHDHKFDPIPTADYYSLYGVFASCEESATLPEIGPANNEEAFKKFVADMGEVQRKLDQTIHRLAETARQQIIDEIDDYVDQALLGKNRDGRPLRKRVAEPMKTFFARPPDEFAAEIRPLSELLKLPANGEFADKAAKIKVELGSWQPAVNPRVAAALQGRELKSLDDVAAVYGELFKNIRDKWRAEVKEHPESAGLGDPAEEKLRQVLYSGNGPIWRSDDAMQSSLGQSESDELRRARSEIDKLLADSPGAPPRAMTVTDKEHPFNPHIFKRGNAGAPGDAVPRQFLALLSGPDRKPLSSSGSGRLELAQAIASPDNPLTARVIVNRVWQWHFGTGLVATASNFGMLGDKPSNPDLLDYLASSFIDSGWSIKSLHRLIMNSRTYQQSSIPNDAGQTKDPGNRLLWRMSAQRLPFEATRDSLLAAAGNLDLETRGGRSVDLLKRPYSTRRSVYGYIDRLNLPKLMRDFDFPAPDSSAEGRAETTVPQQALFLINSPFVIAQARALAKRVREAAGGDAEKQVRQLFEFALTREPTETELSECTVFLQAAKADAEKFEPLAQLSQALLCTNEFMFVD